MLGVKCVRACYAVRVVLVVVIVYECFCECQYVCCVGECLHVICACACACAFAYVCMCVCVWWCKCARVLCVWCLSVLVYVCVHVSVRVCHRYVRAAVTEQLAETAPCWFAALLGWSLPSAPAALVGLSVVGSGGLPLHFGSCGIDRFPQVAARA